MTERLNKYVQENSSLLFKCDEQDSLKAIFDENGFYFSDEAQDKYDKIKDKPHLYVAFTKGAQGSYYIGKSFQRGGRWKRSHYYHMGTLAHHLLGSFQDGEQNHMHWIDRWMNIDSKQVTSSAFRILLKEPVFISFIPFEEYVTGQLAVVTDDDKRRINSAAEKELIKYFDKKGYILLNVQNN